MKNNWFAASPVTINWAVTNRCNFKCRHCYSRADTSRELDLETVYNIINKISGAKVFSINFGGGEPLLRKDIFEIALFASKLGLVVSMNSNGFLIDRDVAQRLKQAGFQKVGISIDSPKQEVHDEFRGVEGSHRKAVAALMHLKEAGIETSISSVICRININDIEGLIGQAISSGAGNINFHNFKCSGLGFTNKDDLDLSPEEWKEFYICAAEHKNRVKNLHISLEDPIIASLGHKNGGSLVKGSVCGKLSLNIKSNGDVTPCGFIPVVIGNLCSDGLMDIWNNSPVLEKMRNKAPKGKCLKCSHYADCLGGCTARALALTGDINNPDPHCWENEP
ncbi:MAG: GeoRSP system radical SAM/SPASM protein [Thermodesulfovibrionales bacterium]|nr:GeoRSP system radical SAM/SPASM protein [Thermodesulfovibrionales bacterium]